MSLQFVWGAALLVIGAGALAISISSPSDGSPRLVGSDFAVNTGASNPGDIRANNSPALARNPVRPGNVVVANRVDSPMYSCGLHVSFDNGREWSDTRVAIVVPAECGKE